MLQNFSSSHRTDAQDNPAGGDSYATGVIIRWQDGPLGRGDDRSESNGAFVETVIFMVRDRLSWYQGSGFACRENELAIAFLSDALLALNERTSRREAAGVEGTHAGN